MSAMVTGALTATMPWSSFKIDLNGATDISNMDPNAVLANHAAVGKSLFLDGIDLFTKSAIAAGNIPAKIEGISFGPDVKQS